MFIVLQVKIIIFLGLSSYVNKLVTFFKKATQKRSSILNTFLAQFILYFPLKEYLFCRLKCYG